MPSRSSASSTSSFASRPTATRSGRTRGETSLATLSWLFERANNGADLPLTVRFELMKLRFLDALDGLRRGLEGVLALAGDFEARDLEEPWRVVVRAYAGAIGLDRAEALAFVERGETKDGKQARMKALFATYDLAGLSGVLGLVYSDLSREESAA